MKKLLITCLLMMTVFAVSADKLKSTRLSFVMSAAVPGAGDFYARNYTKGSISLVREIFLITSLLHLDKIASDYGKSSKIYANSVLGVSTNNNDEYFKLIGNHITSDDYNQNVRLNAQNYYGYGTDNYNEFVANHQITEEQAWDWESEENLKRYRKYRSDKQKNIQYGNFVIGSIIVNHIYSAISTAVKTKNQNEHFLERHSLNLQPDIINQGVSINYGYKF